MKKKAMALILSVAMTVILAGCAGATDVIHQINAETDTTNPLEKAGTEVVPINDNSAQAIVIDSMSPDDFPNTEGYLLTSSYANANDVVIVNNLGEFLYCGTLSAIIEKCEYTVEYPETLSAVCYDRGALIVSHRSANIDSDGEYTYTALYPITGDLMKITDATNASVSVYNDQLFILSAEYDSESDYKCSYDETCYSREKSSTQYVETESIGNDYEYLNDIYEEIILPVRACDGYKMSITEAIDSFELITVFDGKNYIVLDSNKKNHQITENTDDLGRYRYDSYYAYADYRVTETEKSLYFIDYIGGEKKCIAENIYTVLANTNGCVYYADAEQISDEEITYSIKCYNVWFDQTTELYTTVSNPESDTTYIDGITDFYYINGIIYTTMNNGFTTNWYQINASEDGYSLSDTGCVVISYP